MLPNSRALFFWYKHAFRNGQSYSKRVRRIVPQWFELRRLLCQMLTLSEIRKGVERHAPSARRERFKQWLEIALPNRFGNNVLHVDLEIADRWGRLTVDQARTPRPIVDSLLAATAFTHGLTLVTRDTDFVGIPGLEIFNRWALE